MTTRRQFLAGLLQVSAATLVYGTLPASIQTLTPPETLDAPADPAWKQAAERNFHRTLRLYRDHQWFEWDGVGWNIPIDVTRP